MQFLQLYILGVWKCVWVSVMCEHPIVCERARASRWALCKRGSMVCEEIHLSSLMLLLFWKCTPPGSQGVCSLTEGGRAGLCCAGLSLSPGRVSDPMDCSPPGSSVPGDSPGRNTGEGCHALLQGIFLTQDQTQVPCTAGALFTIWTTREAQEYWSG